MVNKSKLSKDVEEQIQSLASDVYIQVEDKITHLIAAAVKAEINQTTDQQNKNSSEKELSLINDILLLTQQLTEKELDADVKKQNFQVELTQNSINYIETIERLEKNIINLKQQGTQQQESNQSNNDKLDDKLLEIEQELNDKNQAIDGLNGRIMVLTEQEQSLTMQLNIAKEQIQLSDKKQSEALTAIKAQVEASAKQKIDVLTENIQLSEKQQDETVAAIKAQAEVVAKKQMDALTEKLQLLESETARVQAETLQSSVSNVKELELEISQLAEQVQQEQNGKAELQQQLSDQQKSIDTAQDKNKQAEQKSQDFQAQIIKLTEQGGIEKQQLHDEIKSINEGVEKTKQSHLNEIKSINEGVEKTKQSHLNEIISINEGVEKTKQSHLNEIKSINEGVEKTKQSHLNEIKSINEEAEKTKQLHLAEIKSINDAGQQLKQLQAAAQQNIIELEKANVQLKEQVETQQNDIKLYQQEVSVLNDQVKIAQEGEENILNRFNSNREKQQVENDKVRETIKCLRDENHQLISDNSEQKSQFNDQTNELEHKLTEYRLKFEYAQKQLTN
jgi:hypothetical protein